MRSNNPGAHVVMVDLKFRKTLRKINYNAVTFSIITLNVVVVRCCFAEDSKKCTKMYNGLAEPVFCI